METHDKQKAVQQLDSAIASMKKTRDEAIESIKILKKIKDDLLGQTKLSG